MSVKICREQANRFENGNPCKWCGNAIYRGFGHYLVKDKGDMDFIIDILKEKLGMAIIMITHDLGVVASMCERIAVMYAGRIVEYGTAEDIFYNPKHQYTKGLIRSIPRLDTKEHERLVPIEGTPVDMLNPPKGCPFAPRCEECMKICLREMPPVTTFSETHYTQCWLNQKEEMEGGAANE